MPVTAASSNRTSINAWTYAAASLFGALSRNCSRTLRVADSGETKSVNSAWQSVRPSPTNASFVRQRCVDLDAARLRSDLMFAEVRQKCVVSDAFASATK